MRYVAVALLILLTTIQDVYANEAKEKEELYLSKGLAFSFDILGKVSPRSFIAAAEKGDLEAQFNLGSMYGLGITAEKDYTKALHWFSKAADQGDETAQYNLAILYINGLGVEKNEAEAARLLRLASEQGMSSAGYLLAKMYKEGRGVDSDEKEALLWLQVAAEQGNVEAKFELTLIGAEQGDAEAQSELGWLYWNGTGVEQNQLEAARWFQLAAEQGNISAQANLGTMYRLGIGQQQDNTESCRWFRRAAEQGLDYAQYKIGECYAKGEGVEKDYTEALRWFQLAADQGDQDAQVKIGLAYHFAYGVEKDEGEAARWWGLAARHGHASAQFNLGLMYAGGHGVIKNYREALRLYSLAAEQGHLDAQNNLGSMYAKGAGIPKNYIQAYSWFAIAAAQGSETARENLEIIEDKMTVAQIAEAQSKAAAFHRESNAVADQPQPEETQPAEGEDRDEVRLTGSAFFVSENGYLLTNYHVVDGCSSVRVTSSAETEAAEVEAVDRNDDLALLRVDSKPTRVVSFRQKPAATGEDVLAIGFPLQGLLTSINATTGSVSATTGAQGDRRFLQISAPVQQGNSGGPLLDASGAVIGVIVSKLNAVKVAEVIGDVPQNINFAIKAVVARSFLSINDVSVIESSSRKKRDRVEVAAEAEEFTVLVECLE